MPSMSLASAALCLILAPLLAAQQVGQAEDAAPGVMRATTLFAYRSSMNRADFTDSILESPGIPGSLYGLSKVPFEVPVELTPVDPAAWTNATMDSTVTFRVVYDVIVWRGRSSYADAYAGSLIEAKVIRMRAGKPRPRHGNAEPRVQEVLVGKSIRLELESSSGGRARFRGFARNLVVWPVRGISMVTLFPLEYVVLGIACSRGCDL